MPPTGSTFTDWQQVEQESRLLMNEDFSWSDPPQRRRRRITEEPVRARRRSVAPEHDSQRYDYERHERYEPQPPPVAHVGLDEIGTPDQPAAHSHFDEMMAQWNAAYGDAADRAFDLDDPGIQVATQGGRRTVVITGRGDDRYMPAPRRPRSAELRFHERSTFSPDRLGFWALLLCIALAIGAMAH